MKGVALTNHSSLATIESTHLNAMSHSLRVLWLGDWVSINGPCDSEFTNLRYLQVGDVAGFPFSNASKMERLTYYHNKSNTGMDFAQLPRTLKTLQYEVPYAAWDEFTTPRLDNLKALKSFLVGSRKPLNLVQGFKLPASLERLSLAGCRKLPETFGHLTNLESLNLNECDFKSLPEGFGRLARLEYLYMECCTCLESLPANFGRLTALRSLHIRGCENLRTLPENFGNLSYLRDLDIRGCVSLQHFPESFSMLSLKFLNLESLLSLEELPESIGNMMSLSVLVIKTCNSLTNLPSSFVNLQMLKFLTIYNCMNLSSFPEDFGQLSSLTHMTVKNCPLLSELPDGFGALPALKVLGLKICRNFVNLSAGFGELHYLEKLYLNSLSFSSLPMGFGELKKLRILAINNAFRLETLPDDIENLVSLRNLHLVLCPMLDGAAMERIVKMQQCSSACIAGSQKLIERWTEIKKEEDYPVAVWTTTQKSLFGKDEDDMDWQRAAKVALFNLNCKELSATSEELMDRSSIAIDMEISVVVISLPLHLQSHHEVPLKNMCELAMRRSSTASSGQLQIIVFLPRAEFDEQRVSAEVEEEEESIIKALLWLPKGSCAIPVADTRRRFLVKELFFRSYLEENQLACFMADLRVQDNGQMLLKDGETIRENDISEKLSETDQKSESEDLETQLPDELQDFFKNVCNSESVLSPLPAEASIFKMLAQLLKRNGIHNYIDCNTLRKISVDQLQGKDVCFIICGTSILQHRNTQLFYNFHNLNFQGVWIPISNSEKYGIGTCIRTCAHMSLRALLPPIAMEDIEENNGHFILLNRDGKMISRAPLSLVMSWGIQSYPFGKDQVNNIISRLSGNSALDFILEDTDIINHRGDKVEMQMIKNRLIFLYSEPPAHKLQMKCRFDQLEQVHQYFPVLYIGHSSSMKQTDMEAYEKLYEVVTKEMYWLKLPFWDMLKFWNSCKYLSSNFAEKLNLPFTLPKLVKQLFIEERWLVFLDSDGVITGSGREVMDIICKSYDENRDDIDIVMKDELLKYNLFSEKCTRIVQTYFNDEIFSHPNHPQHPLSLAAKQGRRFCDVCYVVFKDKSLCHQRTYSCKGCDWDLCKDCWKVYAKSQVQRMLL